MSKQVRLGIVGIGNQGSAYLQRVIEGLCPELVLTAVADIKPERLTRAAEMAPGVKCFDTADEMFKSGLIDAVVITTPHYDHPVLAIESMKHGLHVMVDKPSGVYTKQVREMNDVVAESDVVFGLMFNQRTDHMYRKVKEIVSSGELGRIRRVHWFATNWYRPQVYYDSGAWRATWSGEGGGVLLNQCPHNLDMLQWICGLPVTVDAKMHFGKWHDIEVEDDVTAYFEYENGATGTFITTTGDTPGSNRLEMAFDGGKLLAEDGEITLWKLDMPEPEFSRINKEAFGAPGFTKTVVETDGESEQHIGVLNSFAGAILRGEPLIADGADGINGLMLSNAMHLSAWTGGPVTLPLDEDLFYNELMKRVKSSRHKTNVTEVVSELSGSFRI